jgi:cytochrome c-type biogenesis protein CcmH/NrfG
MRVRSKAILASTAIIAAVALSSCSQLGNLRARKAFKDANTAYQAQNYTEAAARYAEVIADPQTAADPNLVHAYFFLGNSYDNLYKPARKGEAENDALLTKAIENYKLAAEKETDPKMKKLSMDYLVAAYGPDKLNDPAEAEGIVLKMIELDPTDTTNYFVLAQIYEDAGELGQAEAMLAKAKEAQPKDPTVYQRLAGFYQRQAEFDKLIDAVNQRAQLEPNNPEAHQAIASYYWDEGYRNTRLNEGQRKEYAQKGLEAVEKALALNPDYVDAVAYKGLLLRNQAAIEKDAARQKQLIQEANQLQERAAGLKKKQASGAN